MTVLVLGATGNLGPHVVRGLVDRQVQTPVLARNAARAGEILPRGAEIREGDLSDDAVVDAADGAESVFLGREARPVRSCLHERRESLLAPAPGR